MTESLNISTQRHLFHSLPTNSVAQAAGLASIPFTIDILSSAMLGGYEATRGLAISRLSRFDISKITESEQAKSFLAPIKKLATKLYANIPQITFSPTYFHASCLLPQDHAKKSVLEKLAQPSKQELTLLRFTRPDIADRQIKQGKFSPEDIEFYQGSEVIPGQREHKRMGKGVYAIEFKRIDDLASFGEDRTLQNNSTPIKVTLPKGTLILDLTDPQLRQQLKEADIAEHDVAFIDPQVAIKFRENPGNKIFYILKDLNNAKINSVGKADFENIKLRKIQSIFSRMSALGQATIKNYLPDNFVPLKPTLKEKFSYSCNLLKRTLARIAYSVEFQIRRLKTYLRTRQNLEVLNPDKLFPSPTPSDFFIEPLTNGAADNLYNRGRPSIIKIKNENEVAELINDQRFKIRIFSEEILKKESKIRNLGGFQKGDLLVLVTPLPLKLKVSSLAAWPEG
ncbi:MAG: hypothetical protein H0X29_10235, partial [Parachlamydiaceae bacterium]|nr:hypothetical protein [Parachlamydiaceae bacterium]